MGLQVRRKILGSNPSLSRNSTTRYSFHFIWTITGNFFFFFFFISNKDSIDIKRERHPSTQEVYRNEQIKNENYKSQVNPKKKKVGFSTQRTSQIRIGEKEAWDQAWNAQCLQNTYYFSPSKYTTSNKEEQPSKYLHYDGDQNDLASKAKSPIIDNGMTQLTPNKPKTISHNSEATGQWRKRWSTLSLLHLHI